MLFNFIFIHCISLATANFDNKQDAEDLLNLFYEEPIEPTEVVRNPRLVLRRNEYDAFSPNCDQMGRSSLSPFVAILLLKNMGNFLGMGSIIDKARVLTARKVVEHAVFSPSDILALGGRLGPWWGKNSQVKVVDEIYQNDGDLAIAKLRDYFSFNNNIAPIKLPIPKLGPINNGSFAIFGVPRSSVDVPGDPTPKTSMYFVSIEPPMNGEECAADLANSDFNETINFCTSTNGTYGWGCIGSPTVALDKAGKVIQIGVITHTAISEKDVCHIHTKLMPFTQWIRSHSLINYRLIDND